MNLVSNAYESPTRYKILTKVVQYECCMIWELKEQYMTVILQTVPKVEMCFHPSVNIKPCKNHKNTFKNSHNESYK